MDLNEDADVDEDVDVHVDINVCVGVDVFIVLYFSFLYVRAHHLRSLTCHRFLQRLQLRLIY